MSGPVLRLQDRLRRGWPQVAHAVRAAVLFLASEGTSLAVQLRVLVGGALSEKLVGGAHAPPLPTGGVPIPSSRRETKGREGLGESPRCGGPSKGGRL